MSRFVLVPLDQTAVAPLTISARLSHQLVYFIKSAGHSGSPPLGEHEMSFDPAEVARWLEDGVIFLVSPLDTANMTEVELSEEQEALLEWLHRNHIERVRLVETS